MLLHTKLGSKTLHALCTPIGDVVVLEEGNGTFVLPGDRSINVTLHLEDFKDHMLGFKTETMQSCGSICAIHGLLKGLISAEKLAELNADHEKYHEALDQIETCIEETDILLSLIAKYREQTTTVPPVVPVTASDVLSLDPVKLADGFLSKLSTRFGGDTELTQFVGGSKSLEELRRLLISKAANAIKKSKETVGESSSVTDRVSSVFQAESAKASSEQSLPRDLLGILQAVKEATGGKAKVVVVGGNSSQVKDIKEFFGTDNVEFMPS